MNSGDNHTDALFMKRALELAAFGKGSVSPNPLVGCVIVHDKKIIGEGWHKVYGGPHAEVNAVEDVKDKSLLSNSTVYVNLEPCSHTGKTPPCADMLIRYKVKRVVIANIDSNPLVGGGGIKRLQDAGVEVSSGVLENEGRLLNRCFFTFIEEKRPYVILKWAETTDGFISRENNDSKWISNVLSRKLVHKWRTEEDAVLVGTKTAQYDNPKLNARDWTGRDPVRIVLDRKLILDKSLHLFDRSQETICYNLSRDESKERLHYVKVSESTFLSDVINDLYKRGIQSIIVEGGSEILNLFIQQGYWDEARVFRSKQLFESGIKAPLLMKVPNIKEMIRDDELSIYYRH